MFAHRYTSLLIECFHSRGQHLVCKFIGIKESVCTRKSSTPTGLIWDANMATILLFWDTNMATVTSFENTLQVKGWHKIYVKSGVQLKFSKTTTLGTEESGRWRVRFKQESMYGLSVQKSGHCREMAGVERWPLIVEIQVSIYSSNKTYSHLGYMRWLPHKLLNCQSLSTTVLFRTTQGPKLN